MNWLQAAELGLEAGTAIEELKAEIDASQPATAPPIHTFIDGKGGNIGLTWTPDPA
jgi:hypothetical protein